MSSSTSSATPVVSPDASTMLTLPLRQTGSPSGSSSLVTTTEAQNRRSTVTVERKVRQVRRTILKTIGPNGEVLEEKVVEEPMEDNVCGRVETVQNVQDGVPSATQVTVTGDLEKLLGKEYGGCAAIEGQTPAGTPIIGGGGMMTSPMDFITPNGGVGGDMEAVLRQTQEAFGKLLTEQRDHFLDEFPAFRKMRANAKSIAPAESGGDGGGGALVTEQMVLPDGSVCTRTIRRRQAVSYAQTTTRTVNGVVQSRRARAFLQYHGPEGGYAINVVDAATDADGNPLEQLDSESEGDDEDVKSLAPSEQISDGESVQVLFDKEKGRYMPRPAPGSKPTEKVDKAWEAAKELVESEERYVRKLQLLDQVFRKRLEKANAKCKFISKDTLPAMLANLESIYRFHNDHLLPQLLKRRRDWQNTQRISDVMRKQAPFLKMYGEYSNNYRKASKIFDENMRKNKRFAAIVKEIELLPECDQLPLGSHLICPVQRVMKYHLLLQEYLKHLPPNHPDAEDTREALQLTKEAASHANEIMRRMEQFRELINVQDQLGNQFPDLVAPSRSLNRQGKLNKISARSGEHQPRTAFLFNDLVLLCSERVIPTNSKLKLRAILPVEHLQVCEGDRLELDHSFYVRSPQRCIEVYSESAKMKKGWMDAIWDAIQERTDNLRSLKTDTSADEVTSPAGGDPASANDGGGCTICNKKFSAFRRGATCVLCKKLVCKKCASKQQKSASADLDSPSSTPRHRSGSRSRWLCARCETSITDNQNGRTKKRGSAVAAPRKNMLDISAGESSVYGGFVELRGTTQKSWLKRYLCVREDFILYAYKSDTDKQAVSAMPLTGCTVALTSDRAGSLIGDTNSGGNNNSAHSTTAQLVFKLDHHGRLYYIRAPDQLQMSKWMAVLELAANAEVQQGS